MVIDFDFGGGELKCAFNDIYMSLMSGRNLYPIILPCKYTLEDSVSSRDVVPTLVVVETNVDMPPRQCS